MAIEPPVLRLKTCLVVGGARSGKSAYAQTLAEQSGLHPLYLATATIWDAEMRDRVATHQNARDARWQTIEEPFDVPEVLRARSRADTVVVVDCLTLWLTNLMLGAHDLEAIASQLTEALRTAAGPVILVSNEVGQGIVPDTPLGRRFRDAQGRLNQAVATACEAVVFVAAGCPLVLKPSLQPRVALG